MFFLGFTERSKRFFRASSPPTPSLPPVPSPSPPPCPGQVTVSICSEPNSRTNSSGQETCPDSPWCRDAAIGICTKQIDALNNVDALSKWAHARGSPDVCDHIKIALASNLLTVETGRSCPKHATLQTLNCQRTFPSGQIYPKITACMENFASQNWCGEHALGRCAEEIEALSDVSAVAAWSATRSARCGSLAVAVLGVFEKSITNPRRAQQTMHSYVELVGAVNRRGQSLIETHSEKFLPNDDTCAASVDWTAAESQCQMLTHAMSQLIE